MSEFSSTLSSDDIKLTPAALGVMRKLFADVDDQEIDAIRVFVSGGGCGGMTYGMTFTGDRTDTDLVYEDDGVKVYVDAVALQYLRGVEIDYVENGVRGASFVFNNVFQATGGSGTCGSCGSAGGGCA